jgi:hypothetical protein
MSSLRRVQSSKANGALSKGPSTPAVKLRSSENAIIHGLCADCIALEDEERENFLNLLRQHVNHFHPVDEVEFGLVEEMCAARWRQRRAWSIEARMFDSQIALPPAVDSLDRMVIAFDAVAAAPSLSLLDLYETRLNLTYQRSLRTLIMRRTVKEPNEPSPIFEHFPPPVRRGNQWNQPDRIPDARARGIEDGSTRCGLLYGDGAVGVFNEPVSNFQMVRRERQLTASFTAKFLPTANKLPPNPTSHADNKLLRCGSQNASL